MGSAVMSTPASSLNWWYIEGRRLTDHSALRRDGDVEEDPAVRAAPARLHLAVDRPRHLVARKELGRTPVVDVVVVPAVGLLLGIGRLGREHGGDVVEHEPLAFGVAQHPAVATHPFGNEDAPHRQRPHHARRVELDALHVDTSAPAHRRHGVAVAGGLPRVGGVHPRPSDARRWQARSTSPMKTHDLSARAASTRRRR